MEMYQPGAIVVCGGADSLSGDKLGCFNLSILVRGRGGGGGGGWLWGPWQQHGFSRERGSAAQQLQRSSRATWDLCARRLITPPPYAHNPQQPPLASRIIHPCASSPPMPVVPPPCRATPAA